MSPTVTTHVERLAFDSPIHIAAIVAIGIALAGLFAWSLRRERGVIGAKNAVLFWMLRAAALGVALWMLLAPSTIRFQRSTTRQSIAIAVDVSRSMQTVDPPESADELRWALAAHEAGKDRSALAAADRALAAATLAEHRLLAATTALKNEEPERTALEAAAAAHEAIERTKANLRNLAGRIASAESSAGDRTDLEPLREQVDRVSQMLAGSEFRRLGTWASAAKTGQEPLNSDWRESLADLERQTAAVRRRLAELTGKIYEPSIAPLGAGEFTLDDTRKAPRLARVTRFIESLDAAALRPLAVDADVRYASFDWALFPVAAQNAAAAIASQANEPRNDVDRKQGSRDEDDSPVTDLSAALAQLRRTKHEQPLAAVFLFTDAAHNRPGARDPRQLAAEFEGTPIYVVPIGSVERTRDVELKTVSAPGVVMKDDDVVIEAAIEAYQCEGESLRVELLRDGAVIQDRTLELESSSSMHRVRFNAQLAEVGMARLQVRVAPLDGEQSEENNFDQFEINVTRNHIDVLLADELPRWEYRYLSQLFRRDEKVACDELLFRPRRIATGRRQESQEFPSTADEWAEYDVVLLGDVSTERLSVASQESLAAFVRERGGTLVMIAGDEFMPQGYVNQPLEDLLPVAKLGGDEPAAVDGYAFHVTEDGRRHHALMIADTEESTQIAWDFINRNSPVHSISQYRRPRPSARTLISAVPRTSLDVEQDAAQNALLCWQPLGRGRVVYLASPETFRLRFLHGDRLHYRFWGQLLRWAIADDLATGSQWANIRTDRPEYRDGQRVQVTVQLNDESGKPATGAVVEAAAIGAGDSQVAVPLEPDEAVPGRYVGVFEGLPSGVYRVEPKGADVERLRKSAGGEEQETPAASFMVRAPVNRELLDTRSDRALARQIAEASGGQALPPTAVSEVLALTNLKPIITEKTETLPLWVEWKYLWIVFGCLFAEWCVRKRMGLS